MTIRDRNPDSRHLEATASNQRFASRSRNQKIMMKRETVRRDVSELLAQLEAAQSRLETVSNRELNKAVDAAEHALLMEQAREAIRVSEQRFRLCIESSPVPILIVVTSHIVFANEAATAALGGSSSEEFHGRCVSDFVQGVTGSASGSDLTAYFESRNHEPFFSKLRRLDNSALSVKINVVSITFEGAAADLLFMHLRSDDETTSARSISLAMAAFESTTDGILVVDPNGRILGSNRKFAEMWRIPPEIIEAGDDEAAIDCVIDQLKDPSAFLAKIRSLNSQPEAVSLDVLYFKDGRIFERNSQPYRLEDQIAGRVWTFRDVTERLRAEDALKRSELWFREVWNHSSDGMRLATKEGIIVMVNDAFCRMVDRPRCEVEGKSLASIYAREKQHYVRSEHRRRFASRDIKTHFETELMLWNRKKVWFEVANSFLELEGHPPLLLGIFRDITVRKRIELRSLAFSKLGEQLNSATTKEQAARIISSVADELLGWDSCSLQLYLAEQNLIQILLNIDVVNGQRVDVPPQVVNRPPTVFAKKTMNEGPQLILRTDDADTNEFQRFGDQSRPSASLMFVPIRYGTKAIGVLSIQSYTCNAYNQESLQTLQALADHCGGALARLQADAERQRADQRNAAFAKLVRSLAAVENQKEAGRIIVDVADQLFGWDACNIDLYFPGEKPTQGIVLIDTIDGKRVPVPPSYEEASPTPTAIRVMQHGAEIILREEAKFSGDTLPFGSRRPSASIMNAPIRHGQKTIGIFSIQSYTFNAYKTEDLATLQALADHCGGTLERLRNAEKLRDSEQRFQIVSKATNDAIWDWDLTSNQMWWNDGFSKLFGYVDEIDSSVEFWSDRIHPNDRKRVLESVYGLIESGEVIWSEEYRFRRRDGSYAHIFDRGYVIHDSPGKAVRMIGVMMDITDRKRVEQRNAAFSDLGQQLSMATTPDAAALIISNITHDLFAWDAFTMSLYYADKNEVHPVLNFDTVDGKRLAMPILGKGEKPSIRAERVIKNGAELILKEDQTLSPDAVPFGDVSRASASIVVVPIRNKSAVLGIVSVQSYDVKAYDAQDVQMLQTLADQCGGALERIRAEQALRNSELRFHSIWENSVDGMRLTDGDGIIVAVNEAYCRLVGMSRHELDGKPFTVVYADGQNQAELLEKFKNRFQQRVIEKTLTRRLTFRNGKTIDLEDTNSFVEIPGQRPLLLALFRDITQQKRLEEELRHSQKMESVGQLAGGIAHDFNNILTVIQGHASLLLIDKALPNRLGESIQQISQVAERAANLTRQLLTFSRKQVIQPRNLDLNEVVSNMTKMLQRLLGEDISLQVNFLSQLPLIHADPGMMEQILMNLAVNSRDAMPRGGKLFIETSAVELASNDKPLATKHVCLTVKDTGCGIPADILARIFEPFFTTKDVGKGTGLGLATVYGIVKQHDGRIDVKSEEGKGSVFQIFLPSVAASAGQPMENKTVAMKMKGGNETILLVEDEVEVRNLAKIILQRVGYKLIEASSGVHAVELWKQHRDSIDIVVTDIVMPDGMTGRELASRLQVDKPSLKVIFCSGYSTDMVGQESILQEGINFLQKPYTPQKLAQIVRDRLDNRFIG